MPQSEHTINLHIIQCNFKDYFAILVFWFFPGIILYNNKIWTWAMATLWLNNILGPASPSLLIPPHASLSLPIPSHILQFFGSIEPLRYYCCCQLNAVTNRLLLPTGCCYWPSVVTKRVLLPNECCYQRSVVTKQVLLRNRFCYETGLVTKQVLLLNGCC